MRVPEAALSLRTPHPKQPLPRRVTTHQPALASTSCHGASHHSIKPPRHLIRSGNDAPAHRHGRSHAVDRLVRGPPSAIAKASANTHGAAEAAHRTQPRPRRASRSRSSNSSTATTATPQDPGRPACFRHMRYSSPFLPTRPCSNHCFARLCHHAFMHLHQGPCSAPCMPHRCTDMRVCTTFPFSLRFALVLV